MVIITRNNHISDLIAVDTKLETPLQFQFHSEGVTVLMQSSGNGLGMGKYLLGGISSIPNRLVSIRHGRRR
jgi:hypothetical protein